MKRNKGESPYDLFARFLDAFLKVSKNFRLKDSTCIDLFSKIFEPGLSTLTKELKHHGFDQILDWVKIVEGAKCDYASNCI